MVGLAVGRGCSTDNRTSGRAAVLFWGAELQGRDEKYTRENPRNTPERFRKIHFRESDRNSIMDCLIQVWACFVECPDNWFDQFGWIFFRMTARLSRNISGLQELICDQLFGGLKKWLNKVKLCQPRQQRPERSILYATCRGSGYQFCLKQCPVLRIYLLEAGTLSLSSKLEFSYIAHTFCSMSFVNVIMKGVEYFL